MLNSKITIIINTFNSEEQIFGCLDSIKSEYKVIIIENSNNNAFKQNIEKKYKNVECFLTGANLGYGKGNNLGLSKVTSQYALILNPDTTIESQAIDNFFVSADKYKNFSIIGPAVQEDKDKIKYKNKDNQDLIEVNTVKGFAMFLNMKEFENVGFFDENFFIYFEEIDLCKRIKNLNKNIYLDPKITIHHLGGSSHNSKINFEMELSRNWHWMWSTFYYHKKYNGFILALFKVSGKLISSLIKSGIYLILFNQPIKKIYNQRLSGLINSIIGKKSWYRPKIT